MEELALHLLNLVENSVTAGAGLIQVTVVERENLFSMVVEDDGRGMKEDQLEQATFSGYTTRASQRGGQGLFLLQQAVTATGGRLSIQASPGKGCRVQADFVPSHPACKPLGNLEEIIWLTIVTHPRLEVAYTRRRNGRSFTVDTRALGVPSSHPDRVLWLKEHLSQQTASLL